MATFALRIHRENRCDRHVCPQNLTGVELTYRRLRQNTMLAKFAVFAAALIVAGPFCSAAAGSSGGGSASAGGGGGGHGGSGSGGGGGHGGGGFGDGGHG